MNLRPPLKEYKVSLRFGQRYPKWIAKLLKHEDHDGIDMVAPKGTKVYNSAIVGEYVMRIGNDVDGQQYVITYLLTENQNVFMLLYRHLQNVKVKVGEFIKDCEIGEIGKDHLHFGTYAAVDPGKYLGV